MAKYCTGGVYRDSKYIRCVETAVLSRQVTMAAMARRYDREPRCRYVVSLPGQQEHFGGGRFLPFLLQEGLCGCAEDPP